MIRTLYGSWDNKIINKLTTNSGNYVIRNYQNYLTYNNSYFQLLKINDWEWGIINVIK